MPIKTSDIGGDGQTLVASDAAPTVNRPGLHTQFKPGQSGNPTGRRRGSVSLKASLARVATRHGLELVSKKLINLAEAGDVKAIRLLAELLGDVGPSAVATSIVNVNASKAGEKFMDSLPEATLRRIVALAEGQQANADGK